MSSPRRSRRLAGLPPVGEPLNVFHKPRQSVQGHSTVGTFSPYNLAAMAYNATDWLTMGAVSDTVETAATMMSSNPDMSWGEAIGLRLETATRYSLRMGGRYAVHQYGLAKAVGHLPGGAYLSRAASYVPGAHYLSKAASYLPGADHLAHAASYIPGASAFFRHMGDKVGVSLAGQAYTSVADRLATTAVTDWKDTGLEDASRTYYRVVHGETIKAVDWAGMGSGGTKNNNQAMGQSAWQAAGGVPYALDRFMSRQWLHHKARSMGGKAEKANLSSGSIGANIAMTPGEDVLKKRNSKDHVTRVSTTMFVRPGTDVAKRLVFRGKEGERSLFNHTINANRWPVTKAEHMRLKAASSPEHQWSYIPASMQGYIPTWKSVKKMFWG